jgi:8-oxo-dGTP pyrophosphatase MutT (NUDIX family)
MTIEKSGIIPVKIVDGEIHALTMIPSSAEYGGIHPQMAKGLIDDGETQLQAALREGQEEIGLIFENVKRHYALGTAHFGDTSICVFVCTLKDNAKWSEPHYETGSVLWINLDQHLHRIKPVQRQIFQKVLDNRHKYE